MQRFLSPPSAYTDTNKKETMKEREKERSIPIHHIYLSLLQASILSVSIHINIISIYVLSFLYSMEQRNSILPIYTLTHPPDLYPACQIGQGIASAQAKHTHRWARCQ